MKKQQLAKIVSLLAASVLVLASCGNGDSSAYSVSTTTSAAEESSVQDTSSEAATTEASSETTTDASSDTDETSSQSDETSSQSDEKYSVVFTADDAVVIKADTTEGSLEDALNALKDSNALDFTGSQSEYGLYIESVNGRTADAAKNEYWAVYTTLTEIDGVSYSSAEYGTYDYNGTQCASASFGASGLPMVEGELYAIVLATY